MCVGCVGKEEPERAASQLEKGGKPEDYNIKVNVSKERVGRAMPTPPGR